MPLSIFLGYFGPVLFSTLYWSFVNQAFYRFCRILYSTCVWLQSFCLQLILIPTELVLVAAALSPALLWRDIAYIPREHYCYIPVMNLRGVLWVFSIAFGVPLSVLSLVYLQITRYLRQQSRHHHFLTRQRLQRDVSVVRRIAITVSLLMMLGIPAIVILLISYINNVEHPLFFRVEWFFVNFSMLGLAATNVVFTPQLRAIVRQRFSRLQVQPVVTTLAEAP